MLNSYKMDKIDGDKTLQLFKNINNSLFFSGMKFKPHTDTDMFDFISFHNGKNFFDESLLEEICTNYDMCGIQLDALFILVRCMNFFYEKISHNIILIVKEFIKEFNEFNDIPIELVKKMEEPFFADDFTFNLMENMIPNMTKQKFIEDLLGNLKSMDKTAELFISENNEKLNNFISMIYENITVELNTILPIGNLILFLCRKKDIEESEKIVLEDFIKSNKKLIPDFTTDVIIKNYYEYFMDSHDLEIEKWNIGDTFSRHYNNIYELENREKINSKLLNIGFQLADTLKNICFHTLLDCFVENGFANDKKEIAMIIYRILSTEKYTHGYTNKYEDMTLYDHYTLVTIANDINISYENFMQQIFETSKIPLEYPIEIIMRILSRFYNVMIIFYTNKLTYMIIDNYLLSNYRTIAIYQYSADFCYNIIPITGVMPQINILHDKKIVSDKLMNNRDDIIEV